MSRRTRLRRRERRSQLVRVAVLSVGTILASFMIVMLVGTATAVGLVTTWLKDMPNLDSPTAFQVAQTTKVYSADNKLLASLYLENREVVPLDQISPFLQQGVVAVEDERFYEHEGVDYVGIARAIVTDIKAGGFEEGASTITQQYIRNTILIEERTDITPARKVREMVLARELEKRRTKDEILGLYLNTVYFGETSYGAEAAAKTFFGKHAKDLNLAEAAMLAGLPQSPSRLTPYKNLPAAKARQEWVLAKMRDNGYITAKQERQARRTVIKLRRADTTGGVYSAHYFVAYVKKVLQDQYDTSVVFKGGLKVYTTLDTRMQAAAETAVRRNLGQPADPDTALVSIDPRNGHIKAMYGGRDFNKNKFNLATQGKRQPGSSFKVFTLVAALEKGIPPYRMFDASSPAIIRTGKNSPPWPVSNSEGHGSGLMPLDKATWDSVNCVFARLIAELGAVNVATTAKRMGIVSKIPSYPSITLGTQNCSPLEMASAYGTLANQGVHNPPVSITRIVDPDGKVIFRAQPHGRQAVSKQVAYAATQILGGVVTHGTARRANIGRPAAGKTGTSQDYRDAWYVGYTPQLVTSVWVGYHQSERSMKNVRGKRGFGGTLAAPIWHDFMTEALKGAAAMRFATAGKPAYKWKSGWISKKSTEETKAADGTKGTKPQPKPTTPPPPAPKPKPPTTPNTTGTP